MIRLLEWLGLRRRPAGTLRRPAGALLEFLVREELDEQRARRLRREARDRARARR